MSSVVLKPTSSPLGLWCEELSYVQKSKTILDRVTVCAKPGELTVIMGASGSGKTSLMNCLMARTKRGRLQGRLGLNGVDVTDASIRIHAHYVMHDDHGLAYLTVEETLFSTAQLRLPHLSREEQVKAADEVIGWLKLECCRKTLVGGLWRKGISRGQLKRLAIAQELLGNPEILVLDEPTTGLDASLALELIDILKRLARECNKAIIASIHQPRQRAFELFDSLVLLSNGVVLYHGPASSALNWFASLGFKPNPDSSAPDFLLEISTERGKILEGSPSTTELAKPEEHALNSGSIEWSRPQYPTKDEFASMVASYRESKMAQDVKACIEEWRGKPVDDAEKEKMRSARSWRTQFRIIWFRTTLSALRDPLTAFIILLINVVQALLLGSLFFQLTEDLKSVKTASFTNWAVWDSGIVKYLATGIDQTPGLQTNDPLRDMFTEGIDGKGTSLVLDTLTTPGMSDYVYDMARCMRTVLPPFDTNSPLHYPAWSFDTANDQASGSVLENPAKTVSAIVALLQTIDSLTKEAWSFSAPPISATDFMFWFSNSQKITDGRKFNVALCCLGMEHQFFALQPDDSQRCEDVFANRPDVKLPTAPEILDWKRPVGNIKTDKLKTLRRLLTNYITFAADNSINETVAASRDFVDLPKPTKQSFPRKRRLASGLGGLVEDLYSNIFSTATMNELKQSYLNITKQLNDCPNSYCKFLSKGIASMSQGLLDFSSAFLAAVNIGGAVLFLVGDLGFASYDVLLTFPQARAIYNKERAAGLYRSSAFLSAKMIAELPFQMLPAVVWAIIFYFMMGLESSAHHVFTFLGIAILISFAAYSLGYFISAVSPRLEIAVSITPLVFLIMLTLAGIMVRDPQIPKWIAWFRFFSVYRWGYFSICANQFPPGSSWGPIPNEIILTALGVVETRVGMSCLWLVVLAFGFRFLAYLGLVFTNRKAGLEA